MQSIRHEKYETSTELSKKYWEMKRRGGDPIIKWEIMRKVHKYKGGQNNCDLCLTEKLFIIKDKGKHLLNSRSEIVSECRHVRKFLLAQTEK